MDNKTTSELEEMRSKIQSIRDDIEALEKHLRCDEQSSERDDIIGQLRRCDANLDEADAALYHILN